MKKVIIALFFVAAMALTPVAKAENHKGGILAALHGCCFGLRGAIAYNDGKEITAMEWVDRLLLLGIWSAVQGYQGTTTEDVRNRYGKAFF